MTNALPPGSRRAVLAVSALCVLACGGCATLDALSDRPAQRPGQADLAGPRALPRDPLTTVAHAEARGDDGEGVLQVLLGQGDRQTRVRAALALGRLDVDRPGPHGDAVTRPLVRALDDPDPQVRAAAAFALGQRADPASVEALLAHRDERDPLVRARLVDAAGRVDEARTRELVLYALGDEDPGVRRAAALATHAWSSEDAQAGVVDTALIQALASPAREGDRELVPAVLFALARRRAERGRATLVQHARDEDVETRIFALHGLARLGAPDSEADRNATLGALRVGVADVDWRVAVEAATGLGRQVDLGALDGLAEAVLHASPHVRRAAAEALGTFGAAVEAGRERSATLVGALAADPSPMVRARALESGAQLAGDACADGLLELAASDSAVLRAGVARAAAHLSAERALPLLARLAADPHAAVRWEAVSALGRFADPARATLHGLLAHDDNGLRLAAVLALREAPDASDLEPLARAFRTSRGDTSAEVAFNALENAARVPGEPSRALLREGLAHPDPFVRRRAAELLGERVNGADPAAPEDAGAADARDETGALLDELVRPGPGRAPEVDVETSRGRLTFRLLPDDAPRHVANFLALVRQHHYDGLEIHRVVGDYVVQGGDYRGDGNGARTASGLPLRREFGPRPFVRGSLGMPRNEDPDSGGSQIFVMHRAAPHLDGRYTLFGELVAGFEVLDALEVGDRILGARERPRPGAR